MMPVCNIIIRLIVIIIVWTNRIYGKGISCRGGGIEIIRSLIPLNSNIFSSCFGGNCYIIFTINIVITTYLKPFCTTTISVFILGNSSNIAILKIIIIDFISIWSGVINNNPNSLPYRVFSTTT